MPHILSLRASVNRSSIEIRRGSSVNTVLLELILSPEIANPNRDEKVVRVCEPAEIPVLNGLG